ncbi:MAG: N-6 DNA methylase [Desulfobacterales bacterium]
MKQEHRHREESVNTQLALLLTQHGVDAESETIQHSGRHRPDVMFTLGGLRVIIEGKFSDTPDAENTVLSDALKRVQIGICHMAVALVYPKDIRTVPTGQLGKILSGSRLRFLIVSEAGHTEWSDAIPSEILAALRRVHEALIKDDIVAQSAKRLSEKIEAIASLWSGQTATCDRLSVLLGMPAKRGESGEERNARRTAAARVASLVLANAMIFQEQLASNGGDMRVDSLRAYDTPADPIDRLKQHWHGIWTKINYVPIFQIGEAILQEIPVSANAISYVRWLMAEAKSICANQSALRHDLMGRIYHWLLHHGKYLGTYYTATSSATLLLKLVFAHKWEGQDFGSAEKLENFVVADLACGTGTLLMAAAQAITDQFVVSRVKTGRKLGEKSFSGLHQILMEKMLYGYDVLPSAVHLTASTLGMLAPHVTYRNMNLFIMPMGVRNRSLRLGSLDFADRDSVDTQITLDNTQMEDRQTGVNGEHRTRAKVPQINLCVMNPPFVRSSGTTNLLFGSLPDEERTKLQTELKKRVRDLQASVTAGLGSVFLAIADRHLLAGGRLAFILPVALATGEAWGASRKLLSDSYHVEMVMVSHDAERPNFSENTNLSELMFIARKRLENEPPGETVYVNLWYNPRTIYEAMAVASRVRECRPARLDLEEIISAAGVKGHKFAEVISLPASQEAASGLVCSLLNMDAGAAVQLEQGQLAVPGQDPVAVPILQTGEDWRSGTGQQTDT